MYSIKAVAQATGLTVETLRAWERRYNVVTPQRDATGRRAYRPDDVLRLRLLREATDRGHPIRRLAKLSETELFGLVEEASVPRTQAGPGGFAGRMLEAAKDFRVDECAQVLTLAIALLPPAAICLPRSCSRCCVKSGSAGTGANSPSRRNGSSRAHGPAPSGAGARDPRPHRAAPADRVRDAARRADTNWAC